MALKSRHPNIPSAKSTFSSDTPKPSPSPIPTLRKPKSYPIRIEWLQAQKYREEITKYMMQRANIYVLDQVKNKQDWFPRAIAVDWMISLSEIFQLDPKTLFLAVHLLDSCLPNFFTPLTLCYVSATSVHLSCKFHQVYPPALIEIMQQAWKELQYQQILHWEKTILFQIDFKMNLVSAYDLALLKAQGKLDFSEFATLSYYLQTALLVKPWAPLNLLQSSFRLLQGKGGKEIALQVLMAKQRGLMSCYRKYSGQKWDNTSLKCLYS